MVVEAASLVLINPREIRPDPDNVRREGPDDLEGLAESIREHGLLQPLGVARENGGFRVVYGSRRRAAAIMAGLEEVPCLVVQSSAEDRLVRQMLENLQRRDLGDMDKAEGFAALEWPHRVIIKRDPDRLRLYKYTADSAIATVVYVIISVITLGLFVPVWALINLARWSGRSKARLESGRCRAARA